MIPAASFCIGDAVYGLIDSGVANVLGLETLRHGTNLWNNISIRVTGGNPACGGKSTGSTKDWACDDTRNYFYLAKDSECRVNLDEIPHVKRSPLCEKAISLYLNSPLIPRIMAKMHAILSGYNLTKRTFPGLNKIADYFGGIVTAIVSPTLRFRFSEIDHKRFENDPAYLTAAYRTKEVVEPWRLGLLGSLITGINFDWFARVAAKPLKVLMGVAQLTCAVAISVLCVGAVVANPWLAAPAVAGAVLS